MCCKCNIFYFGVLMLKIEPKASCMPSIHCTAELHSELPSAILKSYLKSSKFSRSSSLGKLTASAKFVPFLQRGSSLLKDICLQAKCLGFKSQAEVWIWW